MSRFEEVNRTRTRLEAIAWDIAEHYRKNWRGTGFKGQLATANKELAISICTRLRMRELTAKSSCPPRYARGE